MRYLSLELRCDADMKVREQAEKSIQNSKDFNQDEAYYNVGADEILEIMACFWLAQLEKEATCFKIRETIIDDDFENNVIDYLKASQSLNLIAQEYFKLGFMTGFKLAVEGDRNTLCR